MYGILMHVFGDTRCGVSIPRVNKLTALVVIMTARLLGTITFSTMNTFSFKIRIKHDLRA